MPKTIARSVTPTTAARLRPPGIATLAPDVSAQLNQFALTQADLPAGYLVGIQQSVPNDQASQGYTDQAAVQREIERVGREGGIAQQIFSTNGAGEIGATIEIFKDAGGAQQWVAHPPPLPASMQASPVSLPDKLGDQATALHWTQGNQGGYIVSWRRGRLVFGLGLSAPKGQEKLGALLSLAKSLDAKAQKQAK